MKPSGMTAGATGSRLALLTILAAAAAAVLTPAPAPAYVTPTQAANAADRGANWFRIQQLASGELPGDWGMTALAAAGTNAADVRTTLTAPSAQDFYHHVWDVHGPGGAATDAARAILAGHAGGIQASRISATANMVARIAAAHDGAQIGSAGLLNDDIFGILALAREEAPAELLDRLAGHLRSNQLDDGGWSWSASASNADTDVTGAAIAALCAAGADGSDPAVEAALEHLHKVQDPETGGFAAPPWAPVNTNSTGWVASGFIQCGVDPQATEWTTAEGKTPFDYLLSMQRPDGRFCWNDPETCMGSAAYATWDAVRPLGGAAFSAAPPPREDEVSPAVRPAPPVADDTTVPITLVIDHGDPSEVRMCRVEIAAGSTLGALLGAAEAGSEPEGCVSSHTVAPGANGGAVIEELNGVLAGDDEAWTVSIDRGPARKETSEAIGFGDLVFAQVAEDGDVDPPPVEPPPGGEQRLPRTKILKPWRLTLRKGRVAPRLRCLGRPGERGCRGSLRIRRAGRPAGRAHYRIGSRRSRRIEVRVARWLRRQIRRNGRRRIRLVAASRSIDGALQVTRAKRRVVRRR